MIKFWVYIRYVSGSIEKGWFDTIEQMDGSEGIFRAVRYKKKGIGEARRLSVGMNSVKNLTIKPKPV